MLKLAGEEIETLSMDHHNQEKRQLSPVEKGLFVPAFAIKNAIKLALLLSDFLGKSKKINV